MSIPAEDYRIEWTVGGSAPPANLLPPAEGLALLAARLGAAATEG